jgi:hypothetical protein
VWGWVAGPIWCMCVASLAAVRHSARRRRGRGRTAPAGGGRARGPGSRQGGGAGACWSRTGSLVRSEPVLRRTGRPSSVGGSRERCESWVAGAAAVTTQAALRTCYARRAATFRDPPPAAGRRGRRGRSPSDGGQAGGRAGGAAPRAQRMGSAGGLALRHGGSRSQDRGKGCSRRAHVAAARAEAGRLPPVLEGGVRGVLSGRAHAQGWGWGVRESRGQAGQPALGRTRGGCAGRELYIQGGALARGPSLRRRTAAAGAASRLERQVPQQVPQLAPLLHPPHKRGRAPGAAPDAGRPPSGGRSCGAGAAAAAPPPSGPPAAAPSRNER